MRALVVSLLLGAAIGAGCGNPQNCERTCCAAASAQGNCPAGAKSYQSCGQLGSTVVTLVLAPPPPPVTVAATTCSCDTIDATSAGCKSCLAARDAYCGP